MGGRRARCGRRHWMLAAVRPGMRCSSVYLRSVFPEPAKQLCRRSCCSSAPSSPTVTMKLADAGVLGRDTGPLPGGLPLACGGLEVAE